MMTAALDFSIKFEVRSTDESGGCERFAMSGNTVLIESEEGAAALPDFVEALLRFVA